MLTLEIDPQLADIDAGLGKAGCTSLESALNWLVLDSQAPTIVVVSNHEQMLYEIRNARLSGKHCEGFAAIHFVYLHKPKEQFQAHLTLPTAGGHHRPPADQICTLDNYERFHILFGELADGTVDCSERPVESVANEVRDLAKRLPEKCAEPT